MPRRQYVGGAVATKLNGPVTNATTAIAVLDASTYPSGATAFVIAIDRGLATEEKVLCVRTGGSNTLTATTRGFDGTSAVAHVDAAVVEHVLDAATIDEVNLFANTMTTNGDLLSRTAGAPSRLAIGNTGQQLGIASALPSWQPGYSVWATTTARDAGITVPGLGMLALTTDSGTLWRYNGLAWVPHLGVICTQATRPTGYNGLEIWETDTLRSLRHDGTNWIIMAEPPVVWTPTVTGLTVGNGSWDGEYHRSDGWLDFRARFTWGSTSAITARLLMTLPVAQAKLTQQSQFNVGFADIGGSYYPGTSSLTGNATQTYLDVINTGATYAIMNAASATVPFTWGATPGHTIDIAGRYRMTTRYS
jgi:hypothetical protein